jgi:sterol desaturase/sphingolipid hydroxylase (fatty acid hydroxylase superfamily)
MTIGFKLEQALRLGTTSAIGDAFWYTLLASAAWLVFYVVYRKQFASRKISRHPLKQRQVSREILQSLRSIAIFGLVAFVIVYAAYSGWTRFYANVADYGWTWFVVSIGVMIVLHDTYFYWTHRAMHHGRLYRLFHSTHHLSTSPTPWAAYAFSPLEALVQAGIGLVIAFTIPVHGAAFSIFMLWQIAFNVLGHCGYEIYPRWFMQSRLGWFLNSPTHHALHHEKSRANFSLYFNVWDRLIGTNHPEYVARFEQATNRAQ